MLRPGDHWIARYGVRCCSGLLQSSPPCTVCPLLGVEIAPAPRGRPALHAGRRGTFPVLFRRHRLLAHPHRRAGSACEGSRRNPFSPFRNARRWNLSPLANLRRLGQAPCRARSSCRPSAERMRTSFQCTAHAIATSPVPQSGGGGASVGTLECILEGRGGLGPRSKSPEAHSRANSDLRSSPPTVLKTVE